jgi:CubicO group peptidase (beta-lactamase class C family)
MLGPLPAVVLLLSPVFAGPVARPVRLPSSALRFVPAAAPRAISSALTQLRAWAPAAPIPNIPAPRVTFHASAPSGIDPAKLDALLKKADEEHSGAVIIVKDGAVVASRGAVDEKVYAMSATKSIASLAVGALIDEGKLTLDQPIWTLFPEWKDGDKSAITVRMLLNHTSGLDTRRGVGKPEGIVAHALNSPLVFKPGTSFAYNNNAVDFLAGVIEKASGMKADRYIDEKFFKPMGIVDWDFYRDVKGDPLTAGELMIRPSDLAKFGLLMLAEGDWKGRRLVSRGWVKLSFEPSQPFTKNCGLLWWRDTEGGPIAITQGIFDSWRAGGVPERLLAFMRPLVGREFKDWDEWRAAMRGTFQNDPPALDEFSRLLNQRRLEWVENVGPARGYSARGYLGQYLVVDPDHGLIGVRMRAKRAGDDEKPDADGFFDFPEYVHDLIAR